MMDFIKKNDDMIIICDNINKSRILEFLYKEKQIPKFKIMNLKEFIKKETFDYDTKTIYYLMNKYHLSYENSLVYIKSIYYVENKKYNYDKLIDLVNIKNELFQNGLLIVDEVFKESISSKKIVFYNTDTDYKYIDILLDGKPYEIVNDVSNRQYLKPIFSFETIQDEINYVAEEISKLIDNNICTDNIKLANVSNEYLFLLENIFKSYGLKLDKQNTPLYSTILGQFFIDNLESDVNITINRIKEKFPLDDETLENINKIINICNKYSWCDNYCDIKDMLIYELKNIVCYKKKYSNVIEIVDIESLDINTNNYIFLLGFNQENIPRIYKDDDFITDNMKKELGIETSSEKNIRIKNKLVSIISGVKNLTITYKKKTDFNKYYISSLNDDLNFEIKEMKNKYLESYSVLNLKIDLCKKLDNYVKYGVKSDTLDLLMSSFKDFPYKKYDNNYTKISTDDFVNYLDKKLLLSYSSIDNFYKCQFRFYINNILKLDPFEEGFGAFIGSLMHHMLENCFRDDFNYEKEFSNYILGADYQLTPKDNFFIKKVKEELKKIIEFIGKQKLLTNFNSELYEQKIYIEKNNHIKITFMGIIDKIMYMKKEGKTYLSIIDYKTGNISTDLKYVKHGLTLQLPIYAYLVKRSNLFNDPVITGLYYQKLLSSDIEATTEEEYNKKRYDSLKLIGLSTNNEEVLKDFDNTYEDSEIIKGMKITSKGFGYYSKVFSENELDELLKITENKIDEAITGICNADFKINPKQIEGKNIGCEYCKFKDICYVTENNKYIIEGD